MAGKKTHSTGAQRTAVLFLFFLPGSRLHSEGRNERSVMKSTRIDSKISYQRCINKCFPSVDSGCPGWRLRGCGELLTGEVIYGMPYCVANQYSWRVAFSKGIFTFGIRHARGKVPACNINFRRANPRDCGISLREAGWCTPVFAYAICNRLICKVCTGIQYLCWFATTKGKFYCYCTTKLIQRATHMINWYQTFGCADNLFIEK